VPTIFELAAPPSYKDFFADSYGSASLFSQALKVVCLSVILRQYQNMLFQAKRKLYKLETSRNGK